MRCYIAGPMRGQALHGFPAFFRAAMRLRDQGHEVVNPSEEDMANGFDPSRSEEEQGWDILGVLKQDFRQLLTCEAIMLLPGWENSVGARIECAIALYAGMSAYVMKDGDYRPAEVMRPPRIGPFGHEAKPSRLWDSLPGVKSLRLSLMDVETRYVGSVSLPTSATVQVDIVDHDTQEVLYVFGEVALQASNHAVTIKLDAEVELDEEAA